MNAEGSATDASMAANPQPQSDADTTATMAAGPNFNPLPVEVKPLPKAAELLFANSTEDKKLYWDRSHYDSPESQMKALGKSGTVYIGNMAFSTRSYNVHSHFSQIGPVRKVVMGMDRFQKTPCGFGFVEYVHREDALLAIANLTSTLLDGRVIRVELDAGFQPGRQYGRGASGGQVRDDKHETIPINGSGLSIGHRQIKFSSRRIHKNSNHKNNPKEWQRATVVLVAAILMPAAQRSNQEMPRWDNKRAIRDSGTNNNNILY
jgi:nuclear cap-binding protein subunit 2